jgi:hypothetical protein
VEGKEQQKCALLVYERSARILNPSGDGQHLQSIGTTARPFRRDEPREIVRGPERADDIQSPLGGGGNRIVVPGLQEGAFQLGDRAHHAEVRYD